MNVWMDEARAIAAQCWCDHKTEDRIVDPELVEVVAKKIAYWMDLAAWNQRNTDYYRGLVVQCGEAIGQEAYIQDDGGEVEDVLCAKVPGLVEALCLREKGLLNWRAIERLHKTMEEASVPVGTIQVPAGWMTDPARITNWTWLKPTRLERLWYWFRATILRRPREIGFWYARFRQFPRPDCCEYRPVVFTYTKRK